ncbi:MAG: ferritin [Bacteroidales bacterium]|jgi:ferritin|nr:ferritin [Bacteroidales bacterium]HOL97697.1 ferritin [Bacteroidales bacterium]HOM37424.1 ferritin [Bacteroidales bacterium]HPD24929.1 ferritin [Bacteroidales bacterium]HRT00653.1 ferritin [Bacteroidales bacterium]
MLNAKVEKILNEQIEKEGFSSNLYLAMASWAETKGLEGTAQWLYAQAEEEKIHMLKFIGYINENGGHAIIPAFEKPKNEWKDVFEMFDEVLKHERKITESINKIFEEAVKENDFRTQNWLQWFITEQAEEESSVNRIIDKLNLLGKTSLYLFDKDIMSLRNTAVE